VVATRGAAAMTELLEGAVPFQRFQVERMLDAAEGADAVGRDRVLADVAGVLRPLAPVLRTELTGLVASRLAVPPALVEGAIAGRAGGAPAQSGAFAGGGGGGGQRRPWKPGKGGRWQPEPFTDPMEHVQGPIGADGALTLARGEQAERTFLATCVAVPSEGEKYLAGADLEALFSSPSTRRAAEYLRGRLATPAADLPPDDEALARLIAELVIRAGELDATRENLELEALQLDLARVERAVAVARAAGDGERMRALGIEHAQIHDAIRHRLQ
jgi:DNA primase